MINATKEKLASFFQGTVQYEVPFFQRGYVWDEDNWATLWDHVTVVLERDERAQGGEHFIGTIITKQRQAERLGEQIHDLIDGQQRLTTIAVLLKAISDTATGSVPRLKDVIAEDLCFCDTRNEAHARIIPCSYDRKFYAAIMAGERARDAENQDHRLLRAYSFFKEKVTPMTDERRDRLRLVLLQRISVISMMLSSEDDEQEIFDTINSLGVRLTTAELLKNYIFKDASIQGAYETLWKDIYEESDEVVEFWNQERTAGRIIRTNVEVLLYCYLVIKTGSEVRLESLFKEYKRWLDAKPGSERLAFLTELKEYAEIYSSFPSGDELNEITSEEWEKRFFHVVENFAITTVLPLILYVYKRVPSASTRRDILHLLATYLIRRNVCRLTTKNYNLLFVQIINRCAEHVDSFDAHVLAAIINDFSEDTNRMPTDEAFLEAFHHEPISNQNAREILFLIAIRQISVGLSDVPRLSNRNYTVEHMMPVKWKANWTDRPMTPEEEVKRARRIRTLGNLTLVTGRLNSMMRNAAWKQKRAYLRQYSSLPMTVRYLEHEGWDEERIEQRAQDLASVALTLWSSSRNVSQSQPSR